MRWQHALFSVLLLTACNSLLGNVDHYLIDANAGTAGATSAGDSNDSDSGAGAGNVSGGAGRASGNIAGTAGANTPDPCTGVTCDEPPGAHCDSATQLKTYDPRGSCVSGDCKYTEHAIACDCANDACKSDPCATVTCDFSPTSTCKDDATRTTFADKGTCSAGTCSYAPTNTPCGDNTTCVGTGDCALCTSPSACGKDCKPCGGSTPRCKATDSESTCVECLASWGCQGDKPACSLTTNTCTARPSCIGLAKTCGPKGDSDCCAATVVTGGTFQRINDSNYSATVSDFRLDTYEITVGRFRKFVAAYSRNMIPENAGLNVNNTDDKGWSTSFVGALPLNSTDLQAALHCDDGTPQSTWTDQPGDAASESLPINCIDWYLAQAFCIWDGGRLPTDAEWNFAAAGGNQQRVYAWGSTPAPDCSHANFQISDYCVAPGKGFPSRVGSYSPVGDARFGQADMSGNLSEWVQDFYQDEYPATCDDCAYLHGQNVNHSTHGGWFGSPGFQLATTFRGGLPDDINRVNTGARCALGL